MISTIEFTSTGNSLEIINKAMEDVKEIFSTKLII
jgi:hypothetical protein